MLGSLGTSRSSEESQLLDKAMHPAWPALHVGRLLAQSALVASVFGHMDHGLDPANRRLSRNKEP